MKYDFDLSLEEHTSVGKIITQIPAGSSVLEFGPGNGRMTEYLVKEKNCQVAIVEFDPELYQKVMTFANDGFLGNIDTFEWVKYFANQQFDYIIFADVLEHLTNTEEVLKTCRDFLKEAGRILITFPNLTHNSVLIGLFNNELDWKEYGLLDHTHNTFFTQHGFEAVFQRIDLHIAIEDFTYAQVGQNEIETSYEQLPLPSRYDFQSRLFGEVYQYFYSLSKTPVAEPIRQTPINSNFIKEVVLTYQYTDEKESGMYLFNNTTGENKVSTHQIAENVRSLKIYPLKTSGIIAFSATIDGEEVTPLETNFITNEDELYLFSNKETRPYFLFDGADIAGKELVLSLDILSENQFYDIEETAFYQLVETKKTSQEKIKRMESHQKALENDQEQLIQRCQQLNQLVDDSTLMKLAILKDNSTYRPYSKDLETEIHLNIEMIDLIPDEGKTVIHGWGYSKHDKLPLIYASPATQGAYFRVTTTLRPDVIDSFDLVEKEKYGFILEIDHFIANKTLKLIVADHTGKEWKLKFNRFNLSNASSTARLRRVLGSIKRNGLGTSLKNWQARKNNQSAYDLWIAEYENYDWDALKQQAQAFTYQPKISIVVPVYNVEEKWLMACVNSLKKQVYSNWELCLADDASTESYIKPLLENLAKEDNRIKITFREKNGHISEATNSAIELVTGEYIGFMDNDDELAPNALFEVVAALNQNPAIDFIYTDEDKITVRGQRFDPFFKPDWNEELLLGHNYITHFVVVKKDIVTTRAGGLRHEFNGSQDYDFVLRATEVAEIVHHIPKILYHWRTIETSTALDPQSKEYAYTAGKNSVQAALNRRNIPAEVVMTKNYGAYKPKYTMEKAPFVSILAIGEEKNVGTWLDGILKQTVYPNYEILMSARFTTAIGDLDKRIRFVAGANINEMAANAKGEYLVFLNELLTPKSRQWLSELVSSGQRATIAAATGKINSEHEVVLNVGVALNQEKEQLEFEQRGASSKTIGSYFRPVLPREIYAATADFLLVSKADFLAVGGFDLNLAQNLWGVDLTMQLRNQKGKIIFQPYSEMVSADQTLFDTPLPIADLQGKYSAAELNDPYTNENIFLL
ncbi:glycosyltransferase involved in cell wall biosynthesis/2-polyprenyl-3-methyl-5-hydroxy-6-metoxy-1,4-benzoquinol methylase [Enterococcus sp. PF1-24]|uniref:glycosyltransferase n=1 Tax=unclassified Enterococcus TaxID=2608891 RepID=UPI0024764BD3|nr:MULTISPECIES: glycosyltransferase [unclassified Enterococcus]MDH6364556.1 glycosyltransferase involved in cell wall biosynthesis/2-polyprenyl-3-methyl-5-hydroxy-6-metoxy-1,4-benzoquinol methylase [Enterococcus sp. PFB1-1]MDH6401657.1 glycosyltransferase involved in cell wall biosynthesis/2-polyprenyl-3-methyl-5-hydroxy-6-metoxy-1,4-benzoquinol methylase [Enterococcus sp. PF1-24]